MEKTQSVPTSEQTSDKERKKVSDIVISDQNTALNVMVGFLNVAQQRGVYTVEESAKIWECMKFFMPPGSSMPSPGLSSVKEDGEENSA